MDFIAAASTHTKFNWRVRSLASDFLLEDTWEFPYDFSVKDGVDLHLFQKSAIEPMMKEIAFIFSPPVQFVVDLKNKVSSIFLSLKLCSAGNSKGRGALQLNLIRYLFPIYKGQWEPLLPLTATLDFF